MKITFFAVLMLWLVGCAPPRPYSPGQSDNRNSSTLSRDASDCERQAALSTAGSKAEAFNSCMKARRAPN